MPGLNPEQRDEARNLAADMETASLARRMLLAIELIRLRRLHRAVKRHVRTQHPEIQSALAALRETPDEVVQLVDEDGIGERVDPDHELLLSSTPPRRPR